MTEPIQAVARELGVHLCVGTYERGPERGIVYNSSALIGAVGRGARRLPQDPPVLLRDRHRRRLGHARRHRHRVRHRAGPHRHDHLLRRRLPRALAHPGRAGRRGHLPPVGAAALGRHLGPHVARAGLRQPRLRHRRQRRRCRPGRGALLRQLAHRDADRAHRGQGRDAPGLGHGPARPGRGALVADARLERRPGLRPPARPQPRPHPQPPGRARGRCRDALPAPRRGESRRRRAAYRSGMPPAASRGL